MKIAIALLVLFSLQSSLVLAKTVDEVIEDFLPAIGVLHDDLALKAYNMYKEVLDMIEKFAASAQRFKKLIEDQWIDIHTATQLQLESIVNETGMAGREDEIGHCYNQSTVDHTRLAEIVQGGLEIVMTSLDYAAQLSITLAESVRDRQNAMHASIDAGLTQCKDQSDTPVDTQLCLINHYTLSKTAVQQLLEKMDTTMDAVKGNIRGRNAFVDETFTNIYDRAWAVLGQVLDLFRQCCIAASQTSQ